MVKKIDAAQYATETKEGVCIVDFSATWCGPCQMLAPVLEELSVDLDGKAKFFKLDIDENAALASEKGIASVPSLMVLKDGKEVDLLVGFRPKQMLMDALEKYL